MKHWHFSLFRAFTALIFLYAGMKHLFHGEKILGRIQEGTLFNWYPSQALFTGLVFVSGLVMVVAAVFLFIGKFQKWAAFVLLLLLVGITLSVQLEDLNDLGPFFKNVAIAGSLIFLYKNAKYEFQKI